MTLTVEHTVKLFTSISALTVNGSRYKKKQFNALGHFKRTTLTKGTCKTQH